MNPTNLPAGEAREDEKQIERAADKMESTEPRPGLAHEAMVVPLSATREDGTKAVIVDPQGQVAAARGEVITTLGAEQARHEELRAVKPCVSCAQSYFPRNGSEEWASREAHVSMGKRWSIIHPLESSAEYMCCRAHNMVVHASQTCPVGRPFLHVYRRQWLAGLKAFLARRRTERGAT